MCVRDLLEPSECRTMDELRITARNKKLSPCGECPRHDDPVFAVGCEKHQKQDSPTILFVFRDPSSPQKAGVTGCSADGRVCPWCHSDISANNFKEKLYPLILKEFPRAKQERGRYPVYCINAILHGPCKNTRPPTRALKACSTIVKAYVNLLKPKLTVAVGLEVLRSLGFAYPPLLNLREALRPVIVEGNAFWWTYHPAPQSYNNKREKLEKRFQEVGEYLKST